MRARGPFEVTTTPQDDGGDGVIGRLLLDKRYDGDLVATGRGQMLGARTPDGSGGYVALERVEGALAGRSGTFVLLHRGTMRGGGDVRLEVEVVPGSGTGGLAGLAGTMAIMIEGGAHAYELDYTLDGAPDG